jgi:hypothetical protein
MVGARFPCNYYFNFQTSRTSSSRGVEICALSFSDNKSDWFQIMQQEVLMFDNCEITFLIS